MVTPVNVDFTPCYRQPTSPYLRGDFFDRAADTSSTVKAMSLTLTGAGRIGFYIDYSELSGTGTHTFYLMRTHGTAGPVSVTYNSYGDSHTTTSGIVSWAAGEADIKSITVAVPTKATNGDHRIYVLLSSPTGGATLHHGSKTLAYGVIDDGTIAADADAIFFDSAAAGGGDGSQATPYNNIYTAIGAIGSKRYLYLKGTHTPDGTNTAGVGGSSLFNCVDMPATRTSEATRLYIRNWPGFTFTLQGSGNTSNGFVTTGGESYLTFRGLTFANQDVTGTSPSAVAGGILFYYGGSTDINLELCTFDETTGPTNPANFGPWGIDHWKVWRCTFDNTTINSGAPTQFTNAIEHYQATRGSVQRCTFTGCDKAVYEKGTNPFGRIAAKVAFCRMNQDHAINGEVAIEISFGNPDHYPDYLLIYGNIIKNATYHHAIHVRGAAADQYGKIGIFNNVFDNCGTPANGAVAANDAYDIQLYNNIFYNCEFELHLNETVASQSDITRDQLEYLDFNHEYGRGGTNRYYYLAVNYLEAANLNAAFSKFAANESTGLPVFVDTTDYVLDTGSPCLANGVSGVDQGAYLTGVEVIGA